MQRIFEQAERLRVVCASSCCLKEEWRRIEEGDSRALETAAAIGRGRALGIAAAMKVG